MTVAEPRVDGDSDLSAAIVSAQAGDEEAFRRVYRLVHPSLFRYLRGLVGDDAEDVASETWLQIARGLAGFHGDGTAFRGWAATIGRNRALDFLRHHRRRPSYAVVNEDLADRASDHDTEAEAMTTVATDATMALIAGLPRDQAEAVLLRVVMGLDAGTAGRVLGKRPGAVRTAAYRGLRRLAEHFGVAPDGPSTMKGAR